MSVGGKNFSADAYARWRVEKIAMDVVMQIERDLGNEPADVSGLKCGYDVESRDKNFVRLIEVKGRHRNAATVSKNEILTALIGQGKILPERNIFIDNPSEHADKFPTPQAQDAERKRRNKKKRGD